MKPTDKIALGFVDHGTVRGEFANDLFLLGASRPERFSGVLNTQDALLSRGRNVVVSNFLNTPADWLLFIDADQRFTPDLFDALTDVADDEERPVVTGLYFGIRSAENVLYPVPLPNILSLSPETGDRYDHIIHYPPNAVIRVDGCGAGMLLTHRRVFEAIRDQADPRFGDTCWFRDFPLEGGDWMGEDLFFCSQVAKVGLPIYCHTGAVSPHIKHYLVDEIHFESMRTLFDSVGQSM